VELERDPKKRGAGKSVLVVDDNAAIRKMLASAFLSNGFKTCGEAENGKEAVEAAKQINPDVITLDLSMPVMNGLTAASKLRRIFPTTPIITRKRTFLSVSGHSNIKNPPLLSVVPPKTVLHPELISPIKRL